MDDEEFESLPLEQRRRALELIKSDPTADIEAADLEYKPPPETELQAKARMQIEESKAYLAKQQERDIYEDYNRVCEDASLTRHADPSTRTGRS